MWQFADLRFADPLLFCDLRVCGLRTHFLFAALKLLQTLEICGLITKIWRIFAICELDHLRNLRICNSGMKPRIFGL
jgi:hypothetical protein